MKIFISWSGKRSGLIASALKDWLPNVLLGIEVFVSNHDIAPGQRWSIIINKQLQDSNSGIVCLTPENLNAPWILFEAGAISKAISESLVIPYLLDLKSIDVPLPMGQFQNVTTDYNDTFRMVECINNIREVKLDIDQLGKTFDAWWPQLEKQIERVKNVESPPVKNIQIELLEEIAQYTRHQSQRDSRIETLRNMKEGELWKMKDTDIVAFIQNAINRTQEGISSSEMRQMKDKMALAAAILKEKNQRYAKFADDMLVAMPGIKPPILKENPNGAN